MPLALVALLSLRWLFARLERQQRARLLAARAGRAWRRDLPPATPAPTFVPPSGAKPDAWRKFVRAPVVEEAWVRFCGSIVQEVGAVGVATSGPALPQPRSNRRLWRFPTAYPARCLLQFIYDIWYSTITPDKEFPAEVRRLLNSGFGQLAQRARQLDLRLVMNDLAELFMEQVGCRCSSWRSSGPVRRYAGAGLTDWQALKDGHAAVQSRAGPSAALHPACAVPCPCRRPA